MNNQLAVDLGTTFFQGDSPFTQMGGVSKLVSVIVSNSIVIAGVVLIITIIYAGTSMLTAAGNAQQFESSRLILTSAIIGFVIVVAAWFIVRAIETSTGVNIFG